MSFYYEMKQKTKIMRPISELTAWKEEVDDDKVYFNER